MKSVQLSYFSPTHTTEKIIHAIGDGYGAAKSIMDITHNALETLSFESNDEPLIIGSPVYGGRIPEIVCSRINKLQGKGNPAVTVVVYGNRAYEDALLELKTLVEKKGFKVIAAAAFIGEHSYSNKNYPIAESRPDKDDLAKAYEFGQNISKLCKDNSLNEKVLSVPGDFPYRERKPASHITPETNESLCTKCMLCVSACPTNAIREDNPLLTDPDLCIRCTSCIKICDYNAREFKDQSMVNIPIKLHEMCRLRKEPEIFI